MACPSIDASRDRFRQQLKMSEMRAYFQKNHLGCFYNQFRGSYGHTSRQYGPGCFTGSRLTRKFPVCPSNIDAHMVFESSNVCARSPIAPVATLAKLLFTHDKCN